MRGRSNHLTLTLGATARSPARAMQHTASLDRVE